MYRITRKTGLVTLAKIRFKKLFLPSNYTSARTHNIASFILGSVKGDHMMSSQVFPNKALNKCQFELWPQ